MKIFNRIKGSAISRLLDGRYTLMFVPDLTGKFFRISIPRVLVYGSLGLSFICFLAFAVFALDVIKKEGNIEEIAALRSVNSQQKTDIEKFSKKLKFLEEQLARLEKFDKKLRVITALDDGSYGAKSLASGGPAHDLDLDLKNADSLYTGSVIDVMEKDLGRITSKAKNQELSFLELDEFFREQGSLLAHTPSVWPVKGWLTSAFGNRRSPFTGLQEMHEGLDIATHMRMPVTAPAAGVVIREGFHKGYGNLIELDHGYGITTLYGHNSINFLKVGQKVRRGDVIALVGSTGRSTGPHLHYEVKLNGVSVNPMRYIIEED